MSLAQLYKECIQYQQKQQKQQKQQQIKAIACLDLKSFTDCNFITCTTQTQNQNQTQTISLNEMID